MKSTKEIKSQAQKLANYNNQPVALFIKDGEIQTYSRLTQSEAESVKQHYEYDEIEWVSPNSFSLDSMQFQPSEKWLQDNSMTPNYIKSVAYWYGVRFVCRSRQDVMKELIGIIRQSAN
jgi:hypothetical protein